MARSRRRSQPLSWVEPWMRLSASDSAAKTPDADQAASARPTESTSGRRSPASLLAKRSSMGALSCGTMSSTARIKA